MADKFQTYSSKLIEKKACIRYHVYTKAQEANVQNIIKNLVQKNNKKIILAVLDGLGGLPVNGRTELETARTPNLDDLQRCRPAASICRSDTASLPVAGRDIWGYSDTTQLNA